MSLLKSLKKTFPSPPGPLEFFKRPMFYAGVPFRAMPAGIQCLMLRQILERVLGGRIAEGDFDCLIDKKVRITVVDMQLSWGFGLSSRREISISASAHADTEIRADAMTFLQIATQNADPDTMFFQRRLLILGDTELGHEVKNLMDSIESDRIPPTLLNLLQAWSNRLIDARQWGEQLGQALQYRVPLQQNTLQE